MYITSGDIFNFSGPTGPPENFRPFRVVLDLERTGALTPGAITVARKIYRNKLNLVFLVFKKMLDPALLSGL